MAEEDGGCSNQRYVGGITAEMKRILDIDKILEDSEKEKQKNNYWQRIKNDPVIWYSDFGVGMIICYL